MKSNPMVSIVIPLYNGANYVEEALKCALAQTYENIEIVVVNDGSTDDGAGEAICKKYEDKISYYHKANGGCASALNYGIRMAKGEFISWLSHDDLYTLDKIEKQVNLYEKNELDRETTIVSSVGTLINSKGEKMSHPARKATGFYSYDRAFDYILFGNCPNGCGLLIPKVMFEKYGYFDEGLRFVLDWNLWLKFALQGANFYLDDEALVFNRVHSSQVTVMQKELHKSETHITVDQLFELLSTGAYDESYIKKLYYFSYSTKRGNTKAIKSYLKERNVKYSGMVALKKRAKIVFTRFLKRVYHKFIR